MHPEDALAFKDREEWREWLRRNGRKSRGLWLLIHKKGSKKKGLRHVEALEEALCYGWIDSMLMSVDEDTFVLRFSPRKRECIWSERNKRRALDLIKQSKMTRAGLEKIEEAKASGWWDAALTTRKVAIPLDLLRALKGREEALETFEALSNSNRLQYVFWIDQARRKETRRRRITETVRRMLEK